MSKNPTLNLPVICTRGVVVFPGQDVMVEVGRPKSINAVEESSNSYDNMVFITCQKDIMVEDPKVDDVYSIGTLSKIKVIRRKDGFMRVTFTGMKRARMISLEDSKHMMVATIEPLDEIQGDSLQEATYVKKIIDEFRKFGNLSAAFPSDVLNSLTQGISAITLTDQFAQFFPFDIAVKQQLLEELNLNERMLIIINELEKQLKMNEIEADINDKVKESIDGSQKEYYLREKLKAIKEELGVDIVKENIKLFKTIKTEDDFVDIYYLKEDIDIKKIKIQKEEVEDVKWATIEEINELIKNEAFSESHTEFFELCLDYLKLK